MTKTNKRRRVVSILLVLTMLLTMVPITAMTTNAAEPTWETVTTYEQFAAAMTAEGQRNVKLGADIDTGTLTNGIGILETLEVKGKKQLDLNGHTLRMYSAKTAMSDMITIKQGDLTVLDNSSVQNGTILGSTYNDSCYLINVHSAHTRGKFTLKSGTLKVDAGSLKTETSWKRVIHCYAGGIVTINGGTLHVAPETYEGENNAYGQYFEEEYRDQLNGYCGYTLTAANSCKVTITGGTFEGPVRLDAGGNDWKENEPRIQINGGTFEKKVMLNGTGDGTKPLTVINNGTFCDYVQAWVAASFENSFSTSEVVINGGDFSKKFWLKPKFVDKNDKDLTGYHVAAKLNGGTFHEILSVDKQSPDYGHAPVRPRLSYSDVTFLADEMLGKNAVQTGKGTFAAQDTSSYREYIPYYDYNKAGRWSEGFVFEIKAVNNQPTKIIPNAWGMKSVTLDGTEISYAKDWKGTVERMDNSTAHTIKFKWYPLASELVNAGYSYRAECDRYISGNKTPTTDTISATATEYSFTIPAGADPKVYSFDLKLNLKKDDSPYNIGIYSNEHIVKLVVSEAPPAPPEPVAHSITITNEEGTATPATAIAGETVTVTAKDLTSKNMMFTQWYTKTAGVTFADVTKQETTFVMPDCDVQVYPGYQEVWFTNQPTDSWLSSVDDSKVYFAFSQPITSWKLVNEDNTTLASGNAESAKALVAATLGPKPDKTEMTCRVIVTSNGQNFTSRTFDLKWYNVPGAPDVTVYPEGGKFVETLDVKLKTPNTYWGIAYTTDGSDPYDKSGTEWLLTPSAKIVDDSTQVTISKDTTIKACLYNYEGYSNMEKFGDIVTCDFTKVELTPPVADPPSGTSFYDSLNVSLSTDIVNAKIMVSYNNGDVDDLSDPNQWKEYEPEKESITLSGSYGMHGFDAVTGIQMEHPDGYTYWVHSDKQDYLYPRISYATIADASVVGKVNKEITPVDVSITLSGDVFAEDLTAGTDVSGWFTNLPAGLTAKVKERTNYTATLVITISGTPTATSAAAISVEMPKSALRYTGTGTAVELTVLFNPKAVYNIGMDADHQHDYSGQPYLYLDPGNHYQECKADDGYNIQAHEFTPWTDNENGTHSRHCTVCTMTDGSTYTETAEHTWVWVVDQEAALNQPGKQHEECTGCHAKRSENTEIPALRDYAVTVTGGTATVAAGTPITRAMEGVEVTVTAQAPDGKHFVKWVVKAGGVTLANETSATTTFTMPANDVTIEAEFTENPVESYTLTVIKGTASVAAGTPITDKIEQNTVVTVTADAPEAGKVFDKWVVLEGNVTLADATKATTTFTMPGNDVKLEATYKDAPPSHTHSYGTEWKYDGTDHWHECECGDKTDTAAHSFQWVIDKAATKEATGIKHEECTVCGAKRSENTVIDKLPDGGNTGNTGSNDNNTDKPGNDDSTKCPQTGDSSNHIGWLAALYVSGGVLTLLGVSGKKRKKSEVE